MTDTATEGRPTQAKTVSVIGAHGQIARHLTPILVERGHTVRGLVRKPEQAGDLEADGTLPVICDLEDVDDDDLDAALAGSNTVVFAAGAGADSGRDRKLSLDRDGAVKAVQSAERVGADHFVIVSSMGADEPPEDDEDFSFYLRAKHDADEAVRSAGVTHTIVRPGQLSDEDGTGSVHIADHIEPASIPRVDVASVLAEIIDRGAADSSTFEVVSGDTPIPEAVRQSA